MSFFSSNEVIAGSNSPVSHVEDLFISLLFVIASGVSIVAYCRVLQ